MKKLFRWLLAAWRMLWLGWLKLLALPWRWLMSQLGVDRPAAAPPPEQKEKEAPRAEAAAIPKVVVKRPPVEEPEVIAAPDIIAEPEEVAEPKAAPPPPTAIAAAPGQFTEGAFRAEAGQRDYKLYVPAGRPNGPLPLVVMLHGCKQDPDDFAAGTQMNRLADRRPFLVLYPAQSRSANGFGCWNWFNRLDQQRDSGEVSIIAGMIKHVVAQHAVDPRRVYVAGLSAGGAMATILAHTYPELLAAAGVHSGLPYAAAQDMISAMGVMKRGQTRRAPAARAKPTPRAAAAKPGVPLIVFHGDHDKTVHPLNGDHVIEQALGGAAHPKSRSHPHSVVKHGRVPGGHAYTRTLYSNGTAHAQAEHWLVHGAGHAWSGGNSEGSFTDPLGPDASGEMLRFFLERTKA